MWANSQKYLQLRGLGGLKYAVKRKSIRGCMGMESVRGAVRSRDTCEKAEEENHVCAGTLCFVAQSCPTSRDPMDCSPPGSSVRGDSPGKNTGVGNHFLFQGIFPTQGSNPGLLHCRQILCHLSHQRSSLDSKHPPKSSCVSLSPQILHFFC